MADIRLGINLVVATTSRVSGDLAVSGYAGDERSLDRSEPEELYLFNREDTEYWSYSSGDYSIDYDGHTYTPELIRRGDIALNANALKTKIEIVTDSDNALASSFILEPLESEISVTIYRRHRLSPTDYKVYWRGFIQGVGFRSGGKAAIVCSLKDRCLNRYGLMRKFQRNCGLELYSTWCTISEDDATYQVSGTILTIDKAVITAAVFGTKEDGWLTNGKFKTDSGSCLQKIVYHVGTTIAIARPVAALAVGDTFVANAGCDYLKATCKSKFNNGLNFGGQPYIPSKNPYAGESIVNK